MPKVAARPGEGTTTQLVCGAADAGEETCFRVHLILDGFGDSIQLGF